MMLKTEGQLVNLAQCQRVYIYGTAEFTPYEASVLVEFTECSREIFAGTMAECEIVLEKIYKHLSNRHVTAEITWKGTQQQEAAHE